MYRGFNLRLSKDSFKKEYFDFLYKKGCESLSKQKKEIEEKIESFTKDNGSLDGSKMQANWFPQIEADVFISHSHNDKKLAIVLAEWLKATLGLTAFIDSCVWGYSDELLKIIDDIYCLRDDGSAYIYERRNYSTSHVHTMLSVALTQMIDNTECLFFLNTPNSLTPSTIIEQTESPWIYTEIVMSRLIRENNPRKQSGSLNEAQKTFATKKENIHVSYDLSVDHLTAIDSGILTKWNNSMKRNRNYNRTFSRYCDEKKVHPLDKLYEITEKDGKQ